MNSADSPEGSVRDALVQVRRAYRLIHAYQRRLLDLQRTFIWHIQQEKPKFAFHRWGAEGYGQTPDASRDPLAGKWAWDFIPMYRSDVTWVTKAVPERNALYLGCNHHADSGFVKTTPGEPDALRFDAEEKCRTVLSIYLLRVVEDVAGAPTWDAIWTSVSAPPIPPQAWRDGKAHRAAPKGSAAVVFAGFEVDVERLASPEDVLANLVRPTLQLVAEVER